jgi:hypothetical protein
MNIRKSVVLAIAMFAITPLTVFGAYKYTESEPAGLIVDSPIRQAMVTLKSPLPLTDAINLIKNSGGVVYMVEGDFTDGKATVHDFFPINSKKSAAELEKEYDQNRVGFFLDLLAQESTMSKEERSDLASYLETAKKLQQRGTSGTITVSKISVEGSDTILNSLKSSKSLIESVDVQPLIKPTNAERTTAVVESTTGGTRAATWYPNSGRIETGASNGQRYLYQYMKWNAITFAPNQTYEHDFFLNNSDRKTYLNGMSTARPKCLPSVMYVATTWPTTAKPYLDTRLAENLVSCEVDELAYTIGAAQANALRPNNTYLNQIRTTAGNASIDSFFLQGQIGHRNPSFCFTTWCSWADGIKYLVSPWNSKIPGVVTWTK